MGCKKISQASGCFLGEFFGNEMPGCHGLALNHTGALRLPERQRFEQALYHAACAPQHQGVASNLAAAIGLL
jgi:hypothetical protein